MVSRLGRNRSFEQPPQGGVAALEIADQVKGVTMSLILSPASWISSLLPLLTTLNALFAMSEMSPFHQPARTLAALAETGNAGREAAMDLMENPTKFLSTVQIGITSIGMLNGIVGEAAFSGAAGRS